jgi:hypothetical protein
VGIAPEGEDDDGEGAQGRKTPAGKKERTAPDDPAAAEVASAAAEMVTKVGGTAQEYIKAASAFTGRDGKEVYLTDPYAKNATPKWLNMTLHKLRDMLAVAELAGEKAPF